MRLSVLPNDFILGAFASGFKDAEHRLVDVLHLARPVRLAALVFRDSYALNNCSHGFHHSCLAAEEDLYRRCNSMKEFRCSLACLAEEVARFDFIEEACRERVVRLGNERACDGKRCTEASESQDGPSLPFHLFAEILGGLEESVEIVHE